MPSIQKHNGYLYVEFYSPSKGYSVHRTLKLKATETNYRDAKKKLKAGQILIPELMDDIPVKDLPGKITLSQILPQYFIYKNLAAGTRSIYQEAVKHLETSAGIKNINEYQKSDYLKLINHLNKLKIYTNKTNPVTGLIEKKVTRSGAAVNSQSIYTRTLHSLFTYLVKEGYAKTNIINVIPPQISSPRPIAKTDMKLILDHLRSAGRDQYNIIYFLYNTGIRISTALDLRWEDIQWQSNEIIFRNIKVHGKEYTFPITTPIRAILKEMGIKEAGKIFPFKNRSSLKFFNRTQITLGITKKSEDKQQSKTARYNLHKLKHTFISDFVNARIRMQDLSQLTNTSEKTLRKYYTNFDKHRIASEIEGVDRL